MFSWISRRHYTDEEIIEITRIGPSEAQEVFRFLYTTLFSPVKRFVLANGGNRSDAEDVFQDALMAFYTRVRSSEFSVNKSIGAYIHQTAKYIWINKFNRGQRMQYTDEDAKLDKVEFAEADKSLLQSEKEEFATAVLHELGGDCKSVLTMSLLEERDMAYIAEKMHYASAQIARNKKYRCLERLKRIIASSVQLSTWSDELKNG